MLFYNWTKLGARSDSPKTAAPISCVTQSRLVDKAELFPFEDVFSPEDGDEEDELVVVGGGGSSISESSWALQGRFWRCLSTTAPIMTLSWVFESSVLE